MGGAASVSAEKQGLFSEQDVKDFIGEEKFDQAKFDAAKAADGTVTRNQLMAALEGAAEGGADPTVTLKTAVFMGSARDVVPPWGGEARVGDRVLKHVLAELKARKTELGSDRVAHEVTVFDPKEVFGPGGALEGDGHMAAPHFMMAPGTKPKMDEMAKAIAGMDCFVVVSCEYNHTIPPALTSMMGHFRPGLPNWGLKPSAIVTYSPGTPGGCRAAMALRPFLSELGCCAIAKTVTYAKPAELFDEEGLAKDPAHPQVARLSDVLGDLEWTAVASKKMMESVGPPPKPSTIRSSTVVAQEGPK